MSRFMTSSLGRNLPENDWKSLRGDTILKLLYGVSMNPFNPNNNPVEMDVLMQATGLDLADVHYLIGMMESGGLVEATKDPQGKPVAARLSDRGRDWVSFQWSRVAEVSGSSG